MDYLGRIAVIMLCIAELLYFPIRELNKRVEDNEIEKIKHWCFEFGIIVEEKQGFSQREYDELCSNLKAIGMQYKFEWMISERLFTISDADKTISDYKWKISYGNELEHFLRENGTLEFNNDMYWSVKVYKDKNNNGVFEGIYCDGGRIG